MELRDGSVVGHGGHSGTEKLLYTPVEGFAVYGQPVIIEQERADLESCISIDSLEDQVDGMTAAPDVTLSAMQTIMRRLAFGRQGTMRTTCGEQAGQKSVLLLASNHRRQPVHLSTQLLNKNKQVGIINTARGRLPGITTHVGPRGCWCLGKRSLSGGRLGVISGAIETKLPCTKGSGGQVRSFTQC